MIFVPKRNESPRTARAFYLNIDFLKKPLLSSDLFGATMRVCGRQASEAFGAAEMQSFNAETHRAEIYI